jgi:predicted DNA-binding transcriptional regulator AlpA
MMVNDGERADLMTSAEVAAELRVARSTVERWRFMEMGPKAVYVTPRTVRYRRSDIDAIKNG